MLVHWEYIAYFICVFGVSCATMCIGLAAGYHGQDVKGAGFTLKSNQTLTLIVTRHSYLIIPVKYVVLLLANEWISKAFMTV
jgi:hypothetical protein